METLRKKTIECNLQFYQCLNSKKRIKIFQGGTRSGKTYAICQYLIHLLLTLKKPHTITIARKTLPAIKASVYRDFITILESVGILYQGILNRSEFIFYYKKHKVEFISVDEPQKIRGRKRDILFVNEANELNYEDFRQLIMRTSGQVILDFNPSDPIHWIYDELMDRKDKDEQYWRVYGMGERATFAEGMIYNNWKFIDYKDFPESDNIFLGLDWGYSNDPTAILEIRKIQDNFYIKELCYQKGMTNQDIAQFIKEKKYNEIVAYCDSAEPKSIAELRTQGVLATASIKGQGSVQSGISFIKQFDIYISNCSSNLKQEYQFYIWEVLRDGTKTNKPRDKFDHLMDALRYGIYTKYSNKGEFFVV